MKPTGLSVSPPASAAAVRRTRALLASGQALEALAQLPRDGRDPFLRNARGVCLLQLGRTQHALEELRELVYPDESYSVDTDAPVEFRVNFAAAMLARGSVPAALTALADPVASAHPAARQLLAQLDAWRRELGPWQRLTYRLYGIASRPLPRWEFAGLLVEPRELAPSRAA